MFRGSFVALATPMHGDGSVDYLSLQKLVEFHIENGTHGLVAVGTTGESATLPMDEHIAVVKKIVEYANHQMPVIAGTGANSTEEAIFLSQQLANSGVAGFLSVVPYYNKPQQRGLIAHFEAIADATELPVLLYNVPSRTVTDMSLETLVTLAKHPKIVGIKDATGDLARLREAQQQLPEDFLLFSGDDETACRFMCQGGHGIISVTANIAPRQMADMCELALAQRVDEAHKVDAEVAELHRLLFIESNPVMPKWALYKMGLINTAKLRLPLVEAELNSQKQIEEGLRALGLLK